MPAPGDEHAAADADLGLAGRPDADRQRLEQGGGLVRHGVGHRVGEGLVDDDELGERAVDGRRGVEAHARAEVVAPGEALLAGSARHAGLDRDALPHAARGRRRVRPRRSPRSPRGRAPAATRRRSCRCGRGRSSGCRTRTPRRPRPGPAPHRRPGSGSGRSMISTSPGRFSTATRMGLPSLVGAAGGIRLERRAGAALVQARERGGIRRREALVVDEVTEEVAVAQEGERRRPAAGARLPP